MTNPTEPSIASDAFTGTRRSFIQTSAGVALAAAGVGTGWFAPEASAAPPTREEERVEAGELRLFAGEYVPKDWLGCTGQELSITAYPELAGALGDTYGQPGPDRFRLPDLRGRAVAGSGQAPGGSTYDVAEYGTGLARRSPDELPSTLALTYLISPRYQYQKALIGEVRPFGFDFAPRGWLICNGPTLSINQRIHLFSVIGTRFGGDGVSTFGLPDLRSRTPVGAGSGPGLEPAPIATRQNDLARPDEGRRPRLHVNFCIALEGEFPRRD
jgi:microcystin-dependent protein